MTTSNAKYPKIGPKIDKNPWKCGRIFFEKLSKNQKCHEMPEEIMKMTAICQRKRRKMLRIMYVNGVLCVTRHTKFQYNINMAHTKSKWTEPTPIVVWKNSKKIDKIALIFYLLWIERSYNRVKIIYRSGKFAYQKKYTVKFHKEKPIKNFYICLITTRKR